MELKENQIAALFMGAMLDYDKELQRIATLKAELLRKEAAAKKFRTEMVQLKPGQSMIFGFTGDDDGIFVRELTVACGGHYKIELCGAAGASRPSVNNPPSEHDVWPPRKVNSQPTDLPIHASTHQPIHHPVPQPTNPLSTHQSSYPRPH
jgi:hypothetical protein